ncbi:MAG: carboxymuconolactone decarboxylase family protein [Bacillota bacterium]
MVEAPRLKMSNLSPEAYQHLMQLETLIARHVEPTLYHLIKMRASQINGCAFCLHMHTDQALRHGETPQRLTALDAWEESPLFSDKERAALAWTEEVTLIADSGASKPAFDALKAHFSDEGIGWLVLAVVQINSWNRLAISTRSQYDPKMFGQQAQAEKTPEPA